MYYISLSIIHMYVYIYIYIYTFIATLCMTDLLLQSVRDVVAGDRPPPAGPEAALAKTTADLYCKVEVMIVTKPSLSLYIYIYSLSFSLSLYICICMILAISIITLYMIYLLLQSVREVVARDRPPAAGPEAVLLRAHLLLARERRWGP